MTNINWPANVNNVRYKPYQVSEGPTIITDENDVGTPKSRQRTTGVPQYHTFDMWFTQEEFETLKAWVRFNIRGGALTFNFPAGIDGTLAEMRLIVSDSGWYSGFELLGIYIKITLTMEKQP
jgi:hypothetical protein